MSEIKHTPTDSVLMAYSAGSLPEAFSLVIASHVTMCDESRARVNEFEHVGGAVMDTVEATPMSDGSFEATLALIAQMPEEAPVIAMEAPVEDNIPAPLRDYISGGLADVKWRSVGMGVQQAVLKSSKEASVRLLRIPAGQAMPDHGHHGTEMTLVIKGAFRDETDRFGPGDIQIATDDLHHTPVAEEGEDCICLVATDAPLKFNSLIPRIAQPFLRI
jgi:putative transcriptional regulator